MLGHLAELHADLLRSSLLEPPPSKRPGRYIPKSDFLLPMSTAQSSLHDLMHTPLLPRRERYPNEMFYLLREGGLLAARCLHYGRVAKDLPTLCDRCSSSLSSTWDLVLLSKNGCSIVCSLWSTKSCSSCVNALADAASLMEGSPIPDSSITTSCSISVQAPAAIRRDRCFGLLTSMTFKRLAEPLSKLVRISEDFRK